MDLLGVAVADPSQCDSAREQLRAILPKGAPKLHWSDMFDEEKARATAVVTSFDIAHLVVVGTPLDHRKQERARAQCMEWLYWELGQMGMATCVPRSLGEIPAQERPAAGQRPAQQGHYARGAARGDRLS